MRFIRTAFYAYAIETKINLDVISTLCDALSRNSACKYSRDFIRRDIFTAKKHRDAFLTNDNHFP